MGALRDLVGFPLHMDRAMSYDHSECKTPEHMEGFDLDPGAETLGSFETEKPPRTSYPLKNNQVQRVSTPFMLRRFEPAACRGVRKVHHYRAIPAIQHLVYPKCQIRHPSSPPNQRTRITNV